MDGWIAIFALLVAILGVYIGVNHAHTESGQAVPAWEIETR
jgi:uncharacterized membrane protein